VDEALEAFALFTHRRVPGPIDYGELRARNRRGEDFGVAQRDEVILATPNDECLGGNLVQ